MPIVPTLGATNFGESTLAADITSGATSLSVAAGEGARFHPTRPFRISIDSEIIHVASRSTDTFNGLVRGQEGSTAAAHTAAAAVKNVDTAETFLAKNSMLGMTLLAYEEAEISTTSTTITDMITWSGMVIPDFVPLLLMFSFRKTAGAAAAFQIGFGLNSQNYDPLGVGLTDLCLATTSGTDRAEQGQHQLWLPPRRIGYLKGILHSTYITDGDTYRNFADPVDRNPLHDNDLVTGTINTFRLRGRCNNSSSITGHIRDARLYALGYPGA